MRFIKWLLYYLFKLDMKNMVEIECADCGIKYKVEKEYSNNKNYCNAQCAVSHLSKREDL